MWLIENPWPIVMICVVVALGGVFLWSRNKQAKYLLLAGGMLLLTGAAFLVDAAVLTESEQIDLQVRDLCYAFQRGEVDKATGYFSDTAPELKQIVREASSMVRVGNDLVVSDINVKTIGSPPHYASRFRAKATVFLKSGGGEQNGGHQPSQWELIWKHEAAGWRIVKLSRLNPINQQTMQVFDRTVL